MIKDENLRRKLMNSFPKITDKELISISKEHMPQYVIYKQFKPGKYECYCTKCGKCYINDTSGRNYTYISGHGKKGICLECGSDVTYLAKGRGRKRVYNKENFAVFKLKGDNVYLQTYQIRTFFTDAGKGDFNFKTMDTLYKIDITPYHRYVFTPDGAQKWEHWWHYSAKENHYVDSWEARKSEGEPCFGGSIYVNDSSYVCIGHECIFNSCLKYSLYAAKGTMSWSIVLCYIVKFLCECCKHPNIEYLLKTGFGFIIEDKLEYRHMHGLRINWKQNDVKKMLKLSKKEMAELSCTDSETLSHYYHLRKLDPAMDIVERVKYARQIRDIDTLEAIVKKTGLSLKKALHYQEKQRMLLIDWKDYVEQCIKLGYDIKDESISRPKDFYAAHERLTKILEAMANQEKQRLFEANNRLREEMQYVDEELGLMIVLPKSIDDIVREGKLQNHCVGGYADRHAEGKLHILFLRKISEPETPYYTMEVNTKGDIVQCRGYANNWETRGGKPKTEDVIEFEKRYKEYLKKVFKHTKSKAA